MTATPRFPGLSLLMLSILLLLPLCLWSQVEQQHVRQVDTIDAFVDLFEESDPMHITLTLDLKKYQREKYKGEYMPVHFLYQFNDTMTLEKTMRLKARGEFRRSHCNLAPFWLNIREPGSNSEQFPDIKRIKIVTHCKGSKAYSEYVLKEYLCYKMYNIISPVSFRVRLLRMTYVDTGRKNKVSEGWAFMIEPLEMLAERHDAREVKNDNLSTRMMRPMEMDVLALFQYMIGNVDYSIRNRHNVKILGLPGYGTGGYTPVPYDFDYCGLVNTYYAIPTEDLGIESVRERYYLGPCRNDEVLKSAVDYLNQHREDFIRLVNEFDLLNEKQKANMISYLEEYFALASKYKTIKYNLTRTCL